MAPSEMGKILELLESMNEKLDRVLGILEERPPIDQPKQMNEMKKILRDHMLEVIENYKKMQEERKK
jgi:hypothetical protein